MNEENQSVSPGFLQGSEVARYRKRQPGFNEQLSLVTSEPDIRKKLLIAAAVILGTFAVGLIIGAVLGFFI